MAPGVATRVAERAAIEADPPLREQHWAWGSELDQYRDDHQHRQGEHQSQRRNQDIERAPTSVVSHLRGESGSPREQTQPRKRHAPVTGKARATYRGYAGRLLHGTSAAG